MTATASNYGGSKLLLVFACVCLAWAPEADAQANNGLTRVAGVKVGHSTLATRPTGCTVVLFEAGAVAGVDVRGAAPGTRETALLNPVNTVQQIHAIVLSGGSAFGLATADGVMRYLSERDIGFDMRIARVPIVPAAVLYDLGVGDDPSIRPTADCGYRAAQMATAGVVVEGNVGAGAGATVGKFGGAGRAMKGGVGTASIELSNGVVVAALVAVNAVGDIVDPATGEVVAGVRAADGSLADVRRLMRDQIGVREEGGGHNTTLGIVVTNARLTQSQATLVARMAHDGFARAIVPSHTPMDGDAIFAVSTGGFDGTPNLAVLGALAAEATTAAILRAVRAAESIPGYPAARDLPSR